MDATHIGTAHTDGKVVYVLGAGFSKPAGAPSQSGILEEIFHLSDDGSSVTQARQLLCDFLENDLRIASETRARVALEDIYTPIDRCIADGTSLKNRTTLELVELRGRLEFLISRAIGTAISRHLDRHPGASSYVDRFAAYVVEKAARRAKLAANTEDSGPSTQCDPLAIISLNWDILLDNALHSALYDDCPLTGDYDPFGVVDYCCYVSSLEADDVRVRAGLFSLGCRGYNVKLLKLHGSMNWLQCPNCQRLYVKFSGKQDILEGVGRTFCRHCRRCGNDNRLRGSLVMPTFLKDLSNFQLKLVWQNAGVEIMEAERLVFIGYSLPHADFEFRQLLSRMVRRDARVEVVLYQGASQDDRRRYDSEVERYRQFFGARDIRFHDSGVVQYVNALCGSAPTVA
jgi:hypothetical protein